MEELLKAFNATVFTTPRSHALVKNLQELSVEVQEDFVSVFQVLLNKDLENIAKEFCMKDFSHGEQESFKDQFLILYYFHLLNLDSLAGAGATPLIAVFPDKEIRGLNCLGRAIILGTLIKKIGYVVKLTLHPDHAGIIMRVGSKWYFCEINRMDIKPLHGKFVKHNQYEWYQSTKEDKISFDCFAVCDFDLGILNAIIEHCDFLKKTVGFDFFKIAYTFSWDKFQIEFFQEMNDYKRLYSKEFLLECERVSQSRFIQELRRKFNDVIILAYEEATKEKASKDSLIAFHDLYMPTLQCYSTEVLLALNTGCEFIVNIPMELKNYIKCIADSIQQDEGLKDFAIHVISKKMLDTALVS